MPFADVGPIKVPDHLPDEQVLFLSDIFPTGYMAAENCNIQPGDTVAVWGCGPVGQFAIRSAWMLGAGRVIAIDREPERLRMAAEYGKAETLNFDARDVFERAEGRHRRARARTPASTRSAWRRTAPARSTRCTTRPRPRPTSPPTAPPRCARPFTACRKGGTVSIPGVYGGFVDKVPLGAAFGKGLTFKMGQTHVHTYLGRCWSASSAARSTRPVVITHRIRLDDVPAAYQTFKRQAGQLHQGRHQAVAAR